MDKLEQYRAIIERALTNRANDLKDFPELRDKTVFDRKTDSYLIVFTRPYYYFALPLVGYAPALMAYKVVGTVSVV
jgi:XisI protein